MYWTALLVLGLGFALCELGWNLLPKVYSRRNQRLFLIGSAILALPAVVYDLFYLHAFDNWVWLLELRSRPGAEFLAVGLGVFFGILDGYFRERSFISRGFVVFVLGVGLAVPFLKPVFRPLKADSLRDRWEGDVCLQSSASTCGPASAATILKRFGLPASEAVLARDAHTSASGTEIWYLVRTLRQRGLQCQFRTRLVDWSAVRPPAIVGVTLPGTGSGHFVALLGANGSRYEVADPLTGRHVIEPLDLRATHVFTGFAVEVSLPYQPSSGAIR